MLKGLGESGWTFRSPLKAHADPFTGRARNPLLWSNPCDCSYQCDHNPHTREQQ
jgi:hypothetical protein